ncbi:MAG: NnrS family protein [Magnetococcales bacterium]|nr:NnrS family protein [Magnetococcales bacterium]
MNAVSKNSNKPPLLAIILAMGFRPLFLLAGLWSVLSIAIWLSFLTGNLDWELFIAPTWWHGHEMLFGFVGAAAAGFMLTAAPIWSKSPPLSGKPLLNIVVAWIVGRLAIWLSPFIPPLLVAILDLGFWFLFLRASAPTLWNTGNPVHRIFPTLLALVMVGNVLVHLESVGWTDDTAQRGIYLGIDAIIFFLVVVGGHIMPMFTRETLNKEGADLQFPLYPSLEIAGAVTMTGVLVGNLIDYQHPVTGIMFIVAAVVQLVRFSNWHIFKTFSDPMLWSLHGGFSWLILGLFLSGLARLTDLLAISTALHALTVGAMGFFTLGIMSRISLIHTGHPVVANRRMTMAFFVIFLAATIRILPELPLPVDGWLVAGLLWMAAFATFIHVFYKKLLNPRIDGEPG